MHQNIYFDNAATTPLEPEVLKAILPFMDTMFGNPSSIHSHGRQVKAAIENARKTIASLLNCAPAEIFFTSGGTEADNFVLHQAIETHGVEHIITSPIEHHAVLHTAEHLAKCRNVQLHLLTVDSQGVWQMEELEYLLQNNPKALVSLMHGNNEIGNLINLEAIGNLCHQYGALFHSDTVQTMGHFRHDLSKLPVDFLVGAGHKFHGPKGVGFLYISSRTKLNPFITGGAQERNMRGGTENVYGIVGIAKALEIAYKDMDEHRAHIQDLKKHLIEGLKDKLVDVKFNGLSGDLDKSLYTVLSVSLPAGEWDDMLLFSLDIKGISASGGSACSSGSNTGSHVIRGIGGGAIERNTVRFSFSKYNTHQEVDFLIHTLVQMFAPQPA